MKPSVSSVSPATGAVGSSVTLTGSGFTGATEVAFDHVAAVTINVLSDDVMTAVVPVGATSGRVGVTTPEGVSSNGPVFNVQ
jgi:hypothetical protein